MSYNQDNLYTWEWRSSGPQPELNTVGDGLPIYSVDTQEGER